MKIVQTSIECNADELKNSNTFADCFSNVMRNFLNGVCCKDETEEIETESED